MAILVTGGAGYIGSHTCVALLEAGYRVIIADNLCRGSAEAIKRIECITGKKPAFYCLDVTDAAAVDGLFAANKIDSVLHFAGFKAVGESVAKPLLYYYNNVVGTMVLAGACQKYGVQHFVYSSSATVYGPNKVPFREDMLLLPAANPYGETKAISERILTDAAKANKGWSVVLLRYFNPLGAHESGLLGEDPAGVPSNLMPYITQVAAGKRERLYIFGGDYNTPDGTGVRDYIHVMDLAAGHVRALEKTKSSPGVHIYNLGSGVGYSVLELVRTFEQVTGIAIPYEITGRRPGDIDICYADPGKAYRELGWKAGKTLAEMCRDAWRWQQANPEGYATAE
ncbi:MAG TPA: UDP-glucose 4-epimerase GalE [Firmicutes bacterium]|jgi:UDP-glucose 4-epimerase|nr:UDP-glucose 4-epimerase GalE [Bacillota bacterium]